MYRPVVEFKDPVFAKTVIENEQFGLVFAKTGSILIRESGTVLTHREAGGGGGGRELERR